jgi:small subunit ribosomal protein S18
MDAPRGAGNPGLASGDEDGLDRDGDDRRGGKGRGGAGARRKLLSDEIVAKIDYKNPQILRSFVTDRGKMIPRRISGASARQQRVISTALRRARMLALLPFSVNGD